MTETTSKVEKWSYPLAVEGAVATDPQQFYKALAKAKDGYYPLGANGLWHGGVHFDEATGLVKDLTEVRCIADGEVVAYRIDEAYPKSDFGSTQSVYSTGFVLVKHRLEFPTPPAPAAGVAPAAGPSLTFFSLYMHLLDWDTYKLTPGLGRPAFWSGGTWQVKSTANDPILGLRVRQERSGKPGYNNVLTVLPRGTVVETGEEDHGWLKVVSVTPADANVSPGTGWVFKREMTASATPNSYVIGSAAKDPMTPPQKGLAVHAAANQSSATTAILPIGTQVKIGNEGSSGKYQKLLEIVAGNPVPELTASNGILGYVWEGLLETKNEPAEKNAVHLLERPFPIKAGSLIGHVGKYQNHSDPAPKNLLHLEVFSCEDVKAFTELSKSKATSLPATEKTLLKIPKGSPLITHKQGMNATNPPKVTDAHTETGYDFLIPVGLLEALPAEKKIRAPVVMGGSTSYTLWWRLDGLLGDAAGNEISGWFAEPDIALSRHSPFEWDGFSFIEETVSNVDHLAAFLHAQESLTEEELATYLPNVGTANDGAAKQQLYKILDKNGNKKLTPSEIKEAFGKPWFSQPISQMVTRYESEWQYKQSKWDSLDELMGHSDSDPHKEWVEEKARIERLSWWDKLNGQHGITSDINIQHIHPLGLLAGFLSGCPEKCKAEVYNLDTTVGPYVVSKKLFEFLLAIEAYREHPYALTDDNSGITIGYGYDLGQQTAAGVDAELKDLYTADEIESLKGALGKKGQDARDYVYNVSSISISKDNALKLAVIMKKRYAQQVVDVYPKAINLHPDCQGVLLSLVVNRGNALTGNTPVKAQKRIEMKQIKEDFDSDKPELIPSRLRSMKRLWENDPQTAGVATRREKEAVFFEEALKCNCWK
ncbi:MULTISPECIES: pesticin C-terminus-like muramidase [unclassified Pseudomonas]|uniref:pesticin C-terminus-like muramidase n=1 Tax=unclassified Pseudomonas TaxID=196821 RepID=UPI002AC8E8CE|nr:MULTISPECIES: pesticin C-terminus-like muramidase [unclassified Pseudomonas]MEB0043804.1 pesticin C-terminus-like muramidase [Pseudomonas sp. Dout3]MEB0095258.1 pesticin C-terminus-like muramidase [Pseudomonas sp. DC1.2]WPX58814.1 pesticin C-terminus-like muramidase [Pseudomonas sp. DC1.2]